MSRRTEHSFELIFDGGSRGNPGQGYGSFRLRTNGIEQPIRQLDFGDHVTNNQAEYRTLIAGLKDALRLINQYDVDPRSVELSVLTDSKLVAEQVSGRWKVKNAELRPLRDEARQLMSQFGTARVSWHPRAESVRVLGH